MRGVDCLHPKIRHLENVFRRVTHIDSEADGDLLTDHHHLVKEEGPAVAAGTEQDHPVTMLHLIVDTQCYDKAHLWLLEANHTIQPEVLKETTIHSDVNIRSLLPVSGTPEDIE